MGIASLLAAVLALHSTLGAAPERAVALLATNEVVQLALPSGKVVARRSIGPRLPQARRWSGRMLARSDARIFALAVGPEDWVVVLSARTGDIVARWRLDPGVRYRGLVYSADRLFAYGGRPGREIDTTNHIREQSAVVTRLDAANGEIVDTTELRPGDGHSWWVYWGAADATRVALSYHGGCYPEAIQLCTSGADSIDITGATLRRCRRQASRSNLACVEQVHGMVEPYGVGWIATTGGEELVQIGHDGDVLRRLHSGIGKDHLMDFAFTPDRSGLLVLGSCYGREGLRRISLRTGRSTRLRPNLCGAGVVPSRRELLVRKDTSIAICAPACRTKALGAEIIDLIASG